MLRCHVAAFEALGGVPGEILYDRMRTAVSGEDADGASSSTRRCSSWRATTASCRGRAAPTGPKPRARSSGRSATSARTSSSPAASATSTTSTPSSRHGSTMSPTPAPTRTTRRVVAEHFAEERPSLKPLPAGPFQAVLRLDRRITREGMVAVDGNQYSVPELTRAWSRCRCSPARCASTRATR